MSEGGYYCTSLESLNGPHRVEWFGQIYLGTVTSVAVVFSPWGADPETGELHSSSNKRSTLLVPVSYLRLFRIGDIWDKCRYTGQRDNQTRETFCLDIQEDTVKVMPAGVPVDEDAPKPVFPLPFAVFAGHKDQTNAHCVRVALDDRTMIIIPCMELVRFYFGGSGSFLKRIFSGAFALDRLYSYARLNKVTGAGTIDLAEDLAGPAATTVARIAFDKQARSAAAWIVNSGIATASRKQPYYPKTSFPFHGKTDLLVDGRWFETHGYRVFLAERLLSCSHPFPFDTLFYTIKRSSLNPQKLYGSLPPESKGEFMDAKNGLDMTLNGGEVSSTLQPVAVPAGVDIDDPFPDLLAKRVRRVKPATSHAPVSRQAEEEADLGAGDGKSTAETRAAEVMTDDLAQDIAPEELPNEAIDTFNQAIDAFKEAKPGAYSLSSVVDIEPTDGPFMRADAFCQSLDIRLENIWCAVIKIEDFAKDRLLVLVRGNLVRDRDDHLVVVRINAGKSFNEDVKRVCIAFADETLSAKYESDVLLTRDSELASDLFSILRGLSFALSRLYIKRPA